MGMYTFLENEELELVVDIEIFKEWLKKKHKINEVNEWKGYIAIKSDGVDFSKLFDDKKIISYWYDEFLIVLKELAYLVEGEVFLKYETSEHDANIRLDGKGGVDIHIGTMQYESVDIKGLQRKPLPDMDKKMKEKIENNRLVRAI